MSYPHAMLSGMATHLLLRFLNPFSVALPCTVSVGIFVLCRIVLKDSSWSAEDLIPSFIVHVLSTFLSIVVYRLSPLHPLAMYPGPPLAKTTKLWGAWNSWNGNQHKTTLRLHRQHGPVVRIGTDNGKGIYISNSFTGPNELSIVDVNAVNQTLGVGGLPKGEYYMSRVDPNAPKNLIVLSGETHANRRRLWNRGLSTEGLHEYEHIMARRSEELVQYLKAIGSSGNVDLTRAIGFFTFDFMGDMAFGGPFSMLADRDDPDGLWDVLDRFAITATVVSQIPWVTWIAQRLPLVSGHLRKLRSFGLSMATNRMKVESKGKDLWYHLSDEAELEKRRPPVSDVISDGALAVVAGADTTASALVSFFYFVLSDRTCYEKLRNEIHTVYPPGTDASDARCHDRLVWLDACLNETLRLMPPVPTNGPRQVPYHSAGVTIAGHFVPPGTQVYIPPYSLHRDQRYFSPSPDLFIPSRWLSSSSNSPLAEPSLKNAEVRLNRAAFLPFSYGPANCVGRQLARMEMKMVISVMMQQFDFTFAEDGNAAGWLDTVHDHFVTTRGPLLVNVKEAQAKA